MYLHTFDIVDTAFSYKKELIVCLFLQYFSKEKESSLQLMWNANTAFLLCGAEMTEYANTAKRLDKALFQIIVFFPLVVNNLFSRNCFLPVVLIGVTTWLVHSIMREFQLRFVMQIFLVLCYAFLLNNVTLPSCLYPLYRVPKWWRHDLLCKYFWFFATLFS